MRTLRIGVIALVLLASAPTSVYALALDYVNVETGAIRVAGESEIDFSFDISVAADGLTSATVTPIGGVAMDFQECDPGECSFNSADFDSLGSLRAVFPLGNYLILVNGGADSVEIPYSVVPDATYPDGFPGFVDIILPGNGSTTSTTPTFQWTLCATCAEADSLKLDLNDVTAGDDDVFEGLQQPVADGSFTITSPLIPGHEYQLTVELENSFTSDLVTENGDVVSSFQDTFGNGTRAFFTAVPEPSTALLFAFGLMGLAAKRKTDRVR